MRLWNPWTALTLGVIFGIFTGWMSFVGPPNPPLAQSGIEVTIYLPTNDNQGRPFPEAVWNRALERMVRLCGGVTLGQSLEGCWLNAEGRVQREPVRPVLVYLGRITVERFHEVLVEVGNDLGQEALFVRWDRANVEIVSLRERKSLKGS